jgi:YebC/PmpR family DNA-binding regulatory protein
MAGHSKWANIKRRKEKADLKKGKAFSRMVKEIISAVKQGGPDPKSNARLRIVIQKAKIANLPSDNIERNIKKATSADQADFTEMTYELYGYGGVGIIADVMTDNKNRISSEMRIATNKKGGTVATPGSVAFNFDRKGILQVSKSKHSENELFMIATEAGADDFEVADDVFVITTAPEMLFQVKEKLEQRGITCDEAEIEPIPKAYVECDAETQQLNNELIEYLELLDDVDSVYHNMKVD